MFFPCSGYGIAAQALTSVMKAYDGRGPSTMLTNSILQKLGLSSPEEIIGYLFQLYSCPYKIPCGVNRLHRSVI